MTNIVGNFIPQLPESSLSSSITRNWAHLTRLRPQINVAGKGPDFGPDRASFATSTVTTSIVSLKATDVARIEVDGTAMLFQCDQPENDTSAVFLLCLI